MKCEICGNSAVILKQLQHRVLGMSHLIMCNTCNHQSFVPINASNHLRDDENFSAEYAAIQKHIGTILTEFNRKYFIDFSRLALCSHFVFIDDAMNILEIGPGFPGMFQQLKLTKKKLNFYATEPETECKRLLKEYGVNCISNYFPSRECEQYSGQFDIVFACNVLYYFDNPIDSLRHMIGMLRPGGVILIDILNNKIMDDNYYENNTMTHIFSKESLYLSIEKAGGEVKFLNTCCVKDPEQAYQNIEKASNIYGKIVKKVKSVLKISGYEETMKYLCQVTQLKYGNPEGQYIRAVIGHKQ